MADDTRRTTTVEPSKAELRAAIRAHLLEAGPAGHGFLFATERFQALYPQVSEGTMFEVLAGVLRDLRGESGPPRELTPTVLNEALVDGRPQTGGGPPALHGTVLTAYGEYLHRQQALCRITYRTRLVYFRTARTFLATQPRTLAQITAEHVEQHLTSRGLAPRSMQTDLMSLRSFFRWATQHERLLPEDPCARVSRPRWHAEARPAPTYLEFLQVCRQCRTLEEAALVEGFYYTGLRISELRSVFVRDPDYARRRLAVLGKGGKRRTVMFPVHVADLWQALGGEPDHRLFRAPTKPTVAQRDEQIGETLRRLGREASLPFKLTAHVLRHGYFRLLKTRGVPVEVAARLGGHSDIKMTVEIYGRLDDTDLQNSYDVQLAGLGG